MMKLTNDMRFVLDDLIKTEANGTPGDLINIEFIDFDEAYIDRKIATDSVMQELEKVGALKIIPKEHTVLLTEIGRHYKEIQWLELKEFLFKSVAVPIVIAFITALITTIIKVGT